MCVNAVTWQYLIESSQRGPGNLWTTVFAHSKGMLCSCCWLSWSVFQKHIPLRCCDYRPIPTVVSKYLLWLQIFTRLHCQRAYRSKSILRQIYISKQRQRQRNNRQKPSIAVTFYLEQTFGSLSQDLYTNEWFKFNDRLPHDHDTIMYK